MTVTQTETTPQAMSGQVPTELDAIPVDLSTKAGRIKERDTLNNYFYNVLEPLNKNLESNTDTVVVEFLKTRLAQLRSSYDPRRDALMALMKEIASENDRKKNKATKKKSVAAGDLTALKGGASEEGSKGKKISSKNPAKAVEIAHKGSAGMYNSLPLQPIGLIAATTEQPKSNSGRIKSPPSPKSSDVEPAVQHEDSLAISKPPYNNSGIQPGRSRLYRTPSPEKPTAGSPRLLEPPDIEPGKELQGACTSRTLSGLVQHLTRIGDCIVDLKNTMIKMQGRDSASNEDTAGALLSELKSIHEARSKEFASIETASSKFLSEFKSTRDATSPGITTLANAVKAGNTKLVNAINSSSQQQQANVKEAIKAAADRATEALIDTSKPHQTCLEDVRDQLKALKTHQECLEEIRDQLKLLNRRSPNELFGSEFLQSYSKASIVVNTTVLGKMVEDALNNSAVVSSSFEEEAHQKHAKRNLHSALTSLQHIQSVIEHKDEATLLTQTRGSPASSDGEGSHYDPEERSSAPMEGSEPDIEEVATSPSRESKPPTAVAQVPEAANKQPADDDNTQLEVAAKPQPQAAVDGTLSEGEDGHNKGEAVLAVSLITSAKRAASDEHDEYEVQGRRTRLRSDSVTRAIGTTAKPRSKRR